MAGLRAVSQRIWASEQRCQFVLNELTALWCELVSRYESEEPGGFDADGWDGEPDLEQHRDLNECHEYPLSGSSVLG